MVESESGYTTSALPQKSPGWVKRSRSGPAINLTSTKPVISFQCKKTVNSHSFILFICQCGCITLPRAAGMRVSFAPVLTV